MALTDHASAVLLPPLLQRVRGEAANARVEISAWHSRAYEDVAAGRLDTALSAEPVPSMLEAEVLYHEDFVCVVGSARPIGVRRFTLKQYLDRSHAIVETWEGQQAPVDRRLSEVGAKRRAPVRLPFFVPTVLAVARTDLTLTLPRRLAKIMAPLADVRIVEPPREIKGFSYFMAWHPRLTSEPAHAWFREHLRAVARTI
jgi:DNA-binding transcriptional LysR family regulator